jgi:hypothetical protein
MLLALPVLAAVLAFSFWAFFRYSPKGAANFNRTTVVLCIAMTLYEFWRMRTELAGTPDAGWWPVVASLRASFFVVVFLAVMTLARFMLRRLWIQKEGP